MPTAVREQVLAAFKVLLDTVAAPNVPGIITVYRGRRKEIGEAKMPALNMLVASSGPAEQISAGHTRNILRVTVLGYIRAATDEALDQQLADLAAAVQKAIEADPTLGGIAVDTNIAEDDQAAADEEGVGPLGSHLSSWDVEFWTKPGDPYTAAP